MESVNFFIFMIHCPDVLADEPHPLAYLGKFGVNRCGLSADVTVSVFKNHGVNVK